MRLRFILLFFVMLHATALLCAAESRVVVVFGDSITAGGMLSPENRARVWVRLAEEQSGGRLVVLNEGRGGRPTDSLKEFREMLARRASADIVVLALGTNDSRDISDQCVPKAVANLRAMIGLAREKYGQNVGILIAGPPNIRRDALGPTRPIADQRAAKLRELGDAFAALAEELRGEFVSLYGVVPETSLATDGVHPDVAGNEAIARVMLGALLKMGHDEEK